MTYRENSLQETAQETAVFKQTIQEIQIQVKATLEMVMGDSSAEMLNEMSTIFLEDATPLIDQIKSGQADHDFMAIRQAAHALKGSSATIGLEAFANLCLAIEISCKQNELGLVSKHLAALELEYGQIKKALSGFLQ